MEVTKWLIAEAADAEGHQVTWRIGRPTNHLCGEG
jgi:hypothetical protein